MGSQRRHISERAKVCNNSLISVPRNSLISLPSITSEIILCDQLCMRFVLVIGDVGAVKMWGDVKDTLFVYKPGPPSAERAITVLYCNAEPQGRHSYWAIKLVVLS